MLSPVLDFASHNKINIKGNSPVKNRVRAAIIPFDEVMLRIIAMSHASKTVRYEFFSSFKMDFLVVGRTSSVKAFSVRLFDCLLSR